MCAFSITNQIYYYFEKRKFNTMKHVKLFYALFIGLFSYAYVHADDEIEYRRDTTYRPYKDTVMHISEHLDSLQHDTVVEYPADSFSYKGHYIEAYIGGGYGSPGYKIADSDNLNGKLTGSFSGLLQINYAYFFHKNVGIGIGLSFANHTGFARLNGDKTWLDVTDTDGEQHYDHTTQINRWRERETIHNIGIPLSLQFQHHGKRGVGVFADLGVSAQFAVLNKYNVREGELDHTGYYPAWHLSLDKMHEFVTEQNNPKGKMKARPQLGVFADLGLLIELTKQLDLYIGLYGNFAPTNANSSEKQELGWQNETHNFMPEYDGVWKTDIAGKSHPWAAGLKIGLHWRHIPKPQKAADVWYEHILVPDTTYEYVTRYDTIVTETAVTKPRKTRSVAQQVEEFNIIYFDFDKSVLRDDARKNVDEIIRILKENPDEQVVIHGHACKMGSASYNQKLSERRANAVRNYMIKNGISADRLLLEAHGLTQPSSTGEHNLELDRRVQVIVKE